MKSGICQFFRKTMATFLDENNVPALADSPLCETCSELNLVQMFREGVRELDSITLGSLATILLKKHTCGLCGLISHLISRSWRLDRHPDEDLTLVQVQFCVIRCGWADSSRVTPTTCAYRIRVSPRQGRPLAIHRMVMEESICLTTDLQMMEDDVARFGRERAFHGRRVGAVVNFKLIKKWMRICEKEHGTTCANMWKNVTEQLPRGVRMIDVIQMAVVEAPRNCRYFALSYVWGNINSEAYKTVSMNVAQRSQRGSLESVELPRTIRDAIKLVRELGERYLWVDAICIVQDDADDKATQIAGMHLIYGAAGLTIFAVGRDSADSEGGASDPLPGLEPGSRQQLQRIECIQSLRLAVPLRTLDETLAASKWRTRGWSYQEYLLSRRGLFFTNEQLFFRCQRDVFSEDVIVESSKESASYIGKSHSLGLHWYRKMRYQDTRYSSYSFEFMLTVEEYTRRQLTNPADIYNAIFAIITVFSRDIEITPLDPNTAFVFGMPVSVLEDAMLWQPALNATAHDRRVITGLVTPSWSWAGWKSGVAYINLLGFMSDTPKAFRPLVNEWVIVDPDGQVRPIATGRHLNKYDGPVETDKYFRPFTPPGLSLVEVGEILAPGMLLFYTTVASLKVRKFEYQLDEFTAEDRRRDVYVYRSKFHSVFEILSETSPPATMGRIVLPTDTCTKVPLEFAVLSRSATGCGPEIFDEQLFGKRYEWCLLNVMVVKRVGKTVDGKEISERVGVGVIVEAAWAAARFRERVMRLQ